MINQIKHSDSKSNEKHYISISQFYSGKNVFITGATGFVGKMLVEKLLRSCPEIGNIYLLIRSKKQSDTSERLQSILDSKLFDNIKLNRSSDLKKIKLIAGNLTSDELGISFEDQETLFKHVSVVFHSAATIRFDEPIKTAIDINMNGTRKVINLCHRMEALEAFVYISTAYSNCDKLDIEEKMYTQLYNPTDLEEMTNILPTDILKKITPYLIGKKPNTYALTKAVAEQIILNEAYQLPVTIVRPSIIGASYKEPSPGWVENYGGPATAMLAIGNGVMRTLRIDDDAVADIIPADIVVNLTIAAAWKTAMDKSLNKTLPIYNCVSGNQNPITWGEFKGCVVSSMRKNPLEGVLWYIFAISCNSDKTFKWISYLLHHVPALLIDFYAKCMGKKPIMMRIQKKIDNGLNQLNFFMVNQWSFHDTNVRGLYFQMDVHDRETFQIDTNIIQWNEYVKNYCLGMRNNLLKQNPNSLENCRKQMTRLYYYHHMLIVCLFAIVLYTIFGFLFFKLF